MRLFIIGGVLVVMSGALQADMRVTFPAFGQGDAAVVSTSEGERVLIDGHRSRYDLIDYLRDDRGIEFVDLLIATHPHADHIGGFEPVIERTMGPGSTIAWNGQSHDTQTFERFEQAVRDAEKRGVDSVHPTRGDTFAFDELTVTVLHPARDAVGFEGDLHARPIVVRLDYRGCSLIVSGDVTKSGERTILDSGMNVDVDVLEIGHHGSHTSSSGAWLDATAPDAVVLQYGADNSYGHPHQVTLDRIAGLEPEPMILGTGDQGDIELYCREPGDWEVFRENNRPVTTGRN